jgi:hypothetical protein
MYFPPTAITDTQITNAFKQSLKDQTPENDDDCKTVIESYYFAYVNSLSFEPNEIIPMKEKAQACKNRYYTRWEGLFGGKKYDGYIDYLMGGGKSAPGGKEAPRTYGDTSIWKLN